VSLNLKIYLAKILKRSGSILIFITANNPKDDPDVYKINKKYCDAIKKFGALPILIGTYDLDYIKIIIKHASGILLSGGGDVHAKFFNQWLNKNANNINFERDKFEIELTRAAFEKNIPILGICRGMQVLNIALGGDILQDIKNHPNNSYEPVHQVDILENTKLAQIVRKKKIKVNSMHHQAINNLSNELIISGLSQDKLIESIESPLQDFVLGVQWHPEYLYKKYIAHEKILQAFINTRVVK